VKTAGRTRKAQRLVGFEYDPATGSAHFSMYVPGTGGRERKRATVEAASYDDAVKQWSAFRARVQAGFARPSPEAPTFREFILEYWPSIEANVAPKTARDYRYGIDRHLLPAFGGLRLNEMTSGIVNRFGARLKSAGYAGATVNNYMNLAVLLLGYAVELDVIEESPLKKKLKKHKTNKPCLELNAEERKRFLAAFDDEKGFRRYLLQTMPRGTAHTHPNPRFGSKRRYGAAMRDDSDAAHEYFLRFRRSRLLFIAALETGLRKNGDARGLKVKSVKLADGWISLLQQKTGREVVIPLSRACRAAIEEALAGREIEPEDYVFVTEHGAPYSESTINRYFKIAKQLAGITRRLRFHDLRHTFGSDLATAGLPLPFIGKVMGHTNPATTARYARPDAVVLEKVRDALDRRR
jgi:integrase